MIKIFLILVGILIGIYILLIAYLYFRQDKLVYLPPVLTDEELLPLAAYKHISVTTKDGLTIKGYFLKPAPGKPDHRYVSWQCQQPGVEVAKIP